MANPTPVNASPDSEETIFAAAVALTSPAARAAYLDLACAGRPELRRSVEELLGASDAAGTLLDSSPVAPVPTAFLRGPSGAPAVPPLALPADEGPGAQIGRYKLLEKIGEGGFGEVYVAEQREPVKRKVALKIIKLGMDTRQVIARFEAERQALAMMDHPNIAKVLDAGATDTGRPYFVMELVRGHAITRYCDDNQLTAEQRLKLFILVCHAIQHAHQKGIIHRDIKPSNILVTLHDGVPVPKVIDFGIAKATQGELTDKTIHTQFQSFIGTPAYVSPEQVEMSGLDIDTRSDIYALGVLLYELLVGRTPFDGRELLQAGLDSMRRTIREAEPVRPSTRLSTLQGNERTSVSQRRGGADVTQLAGALRGDVDWIVMKCLEKDRTRRYETANGLAADITRHLTNEPVTARPPSITYRFQKALRRNRLAFAASGAVALALVLGLLAAMGQAIRATRAEREQTQLRSQADRAKELADAARREALTNAADATARLYTSLVGEARATRVAQRVGYREDAFELLKKANVLNTPLRNPEDLRLEAMACLGDFIGFKPRPMGETDGNGWHAGLRLDPTGKTVVLFGGTGDASPPGFVRLIELPGGREKLRWRSPLPVFDPVFSSPGDHLTAIATPDGQDLFSEDQDAHLAEFAQTSNGEWSHKAWRAWPHLHGVERIRDRLIGLAGDFVDRGQRSLRLVDLESGRLQGVLTRDSGSFWPWVADVDPSGRRLAILSKVPDLGHKEVEIWDLGSGQRVKTLASELDDYGDLRFSPDGGYLLACSGEGSAVYRTTDFERVDRISGYVAWNTMGSFAPNRSLLALGLQQQGRLLLRDYLRQETMTVISEPGIFMGAFSPDGELLLTLSTKRLNGYRLDAASEFLDLGGHKMSVPGLAFSPNGRFLASVGKDRTLKIWDADTGRGMTEGSQLLPTPGQAVCFSPDGRVICTGGYQTSRIQFWDAATGRMTLELDDEVGGRTWSLQWIDDPAGGTRLLRASDFVERRPGISSWRVTSTQELITGNQASCVASDAFRHGPALSLVASARGGRIAYLTGDWTGRNSRLMAGQIQALGETKVLKEMMAFGVQGVAMTADGLHVVAASGPNLSLFDIRTGEVIRHFNHDPQRKFEFLALSTDERWLAVGSGSGLGVEIYDFVTGLLRYRLPDQEGTVYWLAWQPGSPRLAVARDNGGIGIWDLSRIDAQLEQLGLSDTR